MKKRIYAAAILIVLILPSVVSGADDTVRISILSKYLRYLEEGAAEAISFSFPAGTVLRSADKGISRNIRSMKFFIRNRRVALMADRELFSGDIHFQVKNRRRDLFKVYVKGKERKYPLPLEIQKQGEKITIIVTEECRPFAVDSAIAEYGRLNEKYNEAVNALAIVNIGRFHYVKNHPVHKGYHFCDLTHCQVYRGRLTGSTGHISFDWIPDMEGADGQLLYSSRCGGKTFDYRIFRSISNFGTGIKDRCSDQKGPLCRAKGFNWTRKISADETGRILFKEDYDPAHPIIDISYDMKRLQVRVVQGGAVHTFAPEDFRLRINRKKGWTFIRSNNYTISRKSTADELLVCFKGAGLGHGVGLCQHGALKLSAMGYSRYEILEHYYPAMKFKSLQGSGKSVDYGLSYVIFSIKTGDIEACSHKNILSRKIPPGSIFKVLAALYLALYRHDLIRDYRYTCSGHNPPPGIPKCWSIEPHGNIGFSEALSRSCNSYFGSLSLHLNKTRFRQFIQMLYEKTGIDETFPVIKDQKSFARMLPGLDTAMRLSVKDMTSLVRVISLSAFTDNDDLEIFKSRIPFPMREKIYSALVRVMIDGTASGDVKRFSNAYGYNRMRLISSLKKRTPLGGKMWGKTSTAAAGTNKLHSYGAFMGGYKDKGIVTILRKGNGHLAAKWALYLMKNHVK